MNGINFKEIEEMIKSLEPKKRLYANEKTIRAIVEKVGYLPTNLLLNPYIPDNQVIYIDKATCPKIDKLSPL